MKEFVEKLIERLEESEERYDDVSFAQLNEFGHTLDYEYAKGKRDGMAESKEIVKNLASEHNNGWISVEDELPPRNESVLCWAVSLARGGDCCCLGSCDNGFWFMQTQIDTYGFPQQYEVVAWHKLPAPYKKGE